MSRRRRSVVREVAADVRYGSVLLSKFINSVMIDGKKSLASRIVYKALDGFFAKIGKSPLVEHFEHALNNAMPKVGVKSKRIGGATYQVPFEIPLNRRYSLVMRWVVKHAREKVGRNMVEGLIMELSDCYDGRGATVKRRDDMHKMADANRAFASLGR